MTQEITPELREWIIAQATAGQPPDVVLKSMIDSGWHEDVASGAMEETLRGFLADLLERKRPGKARARSAKV